MTNAIANPRVRQRAYPLTAAITYFLIVFVILFPKGGIKIAEIPLTFGYVALSLTFPFLALLRFTGFPLRFNPFTLLSLGSVVPFQIVFLLAYLLNGSEGLGGLFSDFTAFFLCPVAFLLVYPVFLPRLDPVRLSRWFRFCVLAAALFGIVLFFSFPITHQLFEVPYLTVNADDAGLIQSTKHIQRGAFLKLISTYNNGNVYGVCTLILLPLYNRLEHRIWARTTLKLALVLTLSRTVWLGLVLEQVLSLLRVGASAARTFPRVSLGPAVKRSIFIVFTIAAVLVGLGLFSGIDFLFDRDLGGRGAIFVGSSNPSLLPMGPVGFFFEIVYVSALNSYGILGFLGIVLLFTFPIVTFLCDQTVLRSPIRIAAFKGLLIYMVLAGVDGAINYIPVMAFYWFVYMVFLEGWPGTQPAPAAPAPALDASGSAPALLNLPRAF